MDPALLELIAAGRPDDEVAVIVRLRPGQEPPPGLRLIARFGDVATGRARRGQLAAIHDAAPVASLKAPRTYAGEAAGPFALRAPPEEPGLSEADPAPVDSDQRRPENLPETGRGTVIAVIDWGIDFAHPDFCDEQGRSRLLAIWDQRAAGQAAPYGYGRIHARDAIDRALGTADPFAALDYVPATSSVPAHGTHVMGIAAGNGRAGGPSGIAPDAELLFVHLGPGSGDLGNSIDILEAIDFAVRAARGGPLALNMSLGRHAGPHDGTLLVERAIDWLVVNRPGTVVVQSTGNYYSRNVHMSGRLREARTARLPFTLPRSDTAEATVELWYHGADRFLARAIAPGGGIAAAGPDSNAPILDRDGREIARLYHRLRDPNNGDNLIALVLRPLAPAGQWRIEIDGTDVVDGRWHAWIERNAACPKCQAVFTPQRASRKTTTGSICNALRTIAVGAYDGHDPEMPLAPFSSVGPTRDGRQKPLLAAPGVRVLSARSRRQASDPPGYVRMSGTSMAAPHVTGTAALMLEAAGIQPVARLRSALFASLDPPPDAALAASTDRWGYGVLNIGAAVAAARALRAGRQPAAVPFDPPGPAERVRDSFERQEAEAMSQDPTEFGEAEPSGAPARPTMLPQPPVATEERRWTKGRDQRLLTPERRILAQFSDAELRDMLDLPPAPPIAVAMREAGETEPPSPAGDPTAAPVPTGDPAPPIDPAAGTAAPPAPEPEPDPPLPSGADQPPATPPTEPISTPAWPPAAARDPQALVNLAVNPQQPQTQIVGFPGARLAVPLLAGDLILRGRRRFRRPARIVARPHLANRRTVRARGGKASEAGLYAETIGDEGWLRIAGPDGLLLPDVTIVRSREAFDTLTESVPAPRPTIRRGSRGPAVREAQSRLNTVHGHRQASGQSGIDRCPLVVDGIFGLNTHGATLAFQRIAFPALAREWDGVIGPRTWAALIAASDAVTPVPAVAATIEFVLDADGDRTVDGSAPVATALRLGLWDQAYDAAGDIRNGPGEADNFVGSDRRRFYIRVRDPGAAASTVTASWRTLDAAGGDDDAPPNASVTLNETAPGSKVFVSRALMLVSDNIDAAQQTHSGFTSGPDTGLRSRGQSNHRLRRAALDGSVSASYRTSGSTADATVTVPVFQRTPSDERRRLAVRVINYGGHATQAQIDAHFTRARARWIQAGLAIDQGAAVTRTIPAAALDGDGNYPGSIDNDEEVAALADLIPITPDDTLTAVFVRLPADGANAYATVFQRTRSVLGDRFFIFINPDVALRFETLGHEFHHVLHNRGDTPVARQFFTFNTDAPALDSDPRAYRRIQTLHAADPDNDPPNDNIVNWVKRRRTARFQNAAGDLPAPLDAPDTTTGNTLTRTF